MRLDTRFRSAVLVVILGAVAGGAAAAPPAATVSPGAFNRAAPVASPCPTFSWAAVEGAEGYELVVVEEAEAGDPRIVLRHRVAGAAFGWTPPSDACLPPGGSYAWSVRALDAAGEPLDGDEGWAALRRFAVPARPSAEEIAAALETLRRWQAGEQGEAPARPDSRGAQQPQGDAVEASGTAAIRGENPATGVDQHGVWGQSASSSGGGLVGVNTVGGPDLVLDGTAQGQADTRLSQSGIDRPSASAQTFNIQNSGGGGMALQVSGTAVSLTGHVHSGEEIVAGIVADARIAPTLTRDSEVMPIVLANDGPGSGLDADTLDGAQATTFQVRVLGTCPPGAFVQAVHVDGTVSCNEVPILPRLTTVDSAGIVGQYTSLALGSDGFPVISYYDDTNQDLKVVKCNDAACAPGGETLTTVDSAGDVGRRPSLTIGTDGFPIISYFDDTNDDLKVVKCNDAACAPGGETFTTVDGTGYVGGTTSLAIGVDGFPVISYHDGTNQDLKVVKCNDAACAPGGETLTTVDSAGNVGGMSSLAIGVDGFPVISYFDSTNWDLKVVKCDDAACAPGGEIITTVDSTDLVGQFNSLAFGADGFPVISYWDLTNRDLKVVKCNDPACAPGGETLTTVDSAGWVGEHTSLALGTDGFPVISYFDDTNDDLKVVKCNDPACAPGGETITTVDGTGWVGEYTSLAIGTDGFPVISYLDSGTNGDLRVAKCRNASCNF